MLTIIKLIGTTCLSTLPTIKSFVVATSFFLILEKIIPVEKNHPLKHYVFNFQYTLLYILVSPFIVLLPTILATAISHVTHGSLIVINLEKIHCNWALHTLVLPFLPILIFDFFYYWHHRLQHKIPLLWAQHKLHHTEESLCCMTNLRHHWLEDGIRVFTITIPMMLLISLTPVQCAWASVILSQWSLFFHANLRIPLGPLTPIISGPQLHRIHHSRQIQHINKNFAAFFPVWDILFGTYYRPHPGEWPATGLLNDEQVTNIWEASILPFRAWSYMVTKKLNFTRSHGCRIKI